MERKTQASAEAVHFELRALEAVMRFAASRCASWPSFALRAGDELAGKGWPKTEQGRGVFLTFEADASRSELAAALS